MLVCFLFSLKVRGSTQVRFNKVDEFGLIQTYYVMVQFKLGSNNRESARWSFKSGC